MKFPNITVKSEWHILDFKYEVSYAADTATHRNRYAQAVSKILILHSLMGSSPLFRRASTIIIAPNSKTKMIAPAFMFVLESVRTESKFYVIF